MVLSLKPANEDLAATASETATIALRLADHDHGERLNAIVAAVVKAVAQVAYAGSHPEGIRFRISPADQAFRLKNSQQKDKIAEDLLPLLAAQLQPFVLDDFRVCVEDLELTSRELTLIIGFTLLRSKPATATGFEDTDV